MLLDEILMNLNESAEAVHPEDCDCEECKAKKAECEDGECIEECGDAQSFWSETGIDESEDKELEDLNSEMRKLMKKRSECASGSAKQEKINDKLDKIYDRRHELMSKKSLNEDGEGTKVLEALEDINAEQEINEKDFKCNSVEYGLKSGKMTCDGEDITDAFFGAEKAGSKAAEKAGEPVEECSTKMNEYEGTTSNNAEAGAGIGADIGRWVGKGLDKAKEYGKQAADYLGNEFNKAREALHKDVAASGLKEDDGESQVIYDGTYYNFVGDAEPISDEECREEKEELDRECPKFSNGCKYYDKDKQRTDQAGYLRGFGCEVDEEDEKPTFDSEEDQIPEKRYMLDAVTEPVEKIEYDENEKTPAEELDEIFAAAMPPVLAGTNPALLTTKPTVPTEILKAGVENAAKSKPWISGRNIANAAAEGAAGAGAGYLAWELLDKAKDVADKVSNSDDSEEAQQEFKVFRAPAHQERYTDDYLDESMYKISKKDGSSEYIMAESAEKFAEYISESFEDIVSFEKIDTKALNESMDHEIVDTVVTEVSKDKKASMGEIQSMLNDMVDDSMSEEFVKTIYNKIINRLADAGIEVSE